MVASFGNLLGSVTHLQGMRIGVVDIYPMGDKTAVPNLDFTCTPNNGIFTEKTMLPNLDSSVRTKKIHAPE
jgi:hypothetical protein